MKVNANYAKLANSYLFADISRRVADFQKANPAADIIRMGIGDVTLPLCPSVIGALRQAVDEMSVKETFRGYGPEQGYSFLREAIQGYYQERGVALELDEIFVGDGGKSDISNILDLFALDNTVAVPDPVYPVYADTNVMAGRKIIYMNADETNGFLPMPGPDMKADIFYLCSPNNPTGAAYDREQLKVWVDFAASQKALILYDAAYEIFIDRPEIPRSIFEIPGARDTAIEFCSFSKTAGFTGVRCGYTIVPKNLVYDELSLNKMWSRRQTTKFNGVSYISQKAAAAVFTPAGMLQIKETIAYYKENALVIARALDELGIVFFGGYCSPYIWLKCPRGMESWDFFDFLLRGAHIVGTPGGGFGVNGKYFFRLSAFNTRENTAAAMERLKKLLA
ncbi:MAG: LL-diaminopimelate aminotransferase [Peptococcaceae bacterium]|jgi:LL-diaminopimelate aminotransferase|nr:LL-diaminopimelate aminotransferase [Peptococcaceae bacterium]